MAATADCTDGAVGVNKDGTQQQRKARIVLWSAETTTCIAVIEVLDSVLCLMHAVFDI